MSMSQGVLQEKVKALVGYLFKYYESYRDILLKPLLATYYIPLPDCPDGLLRAVGRGVDDVADGEVRLPVLGHQLLVRGLQQLRMQTLSLKV